jgi:hypothetical protein
VSDSNEVEDLRQKLTQAHLEAEMYKRQCDRICELAREYICASILCLRGRPGRKHPVMVAMRKLDWAIDHVDSIPGVAEAIAEQE